jgi:signal transduction histidine kinase
MIRQELHNLRSTITNRILVTNILVISFPYFSAMVRNVQMGWTHLIVLHTVIFLSFMCVGFFRKKLDVNIKLYSVASLYNFIGLVGLYNFGVSGGHYYILVGISVVAILDQSTVSRIYIACIVLIYSTIALLFGFDILEPNFGELDVVDSSIHRAALTMATVSLSIIYIHGFGHYYKLLTIIVNRKAVAEKELHKINLELESRVDARTLELIEINKKLSAKSEIIHHQNNELSASVDKLKQTHFKLLQADKMASLGVLTAGVAHEINNPLNYIMGAYEGLVTHFDENQTKDEHVEQMLGFLKEGLSKTTNIIQSLNNFSRSNSSKDEFYQIESIIENCLSILHFTFKNKITIHKNLGHADLQAYGNVGQLHQVFTNLLTNAMQACTSPGVISIRTSSTDTSLLIEIEDNGHGIEKENMKKIIEPFYTTKGPGVGTGLGLYIAYNIVKDHKGLMEFESEVNKGTKVVISLPANPKEA